MMYVFKFLVDVCDVNNFKHTRELRFIKGNQQVIYFQLQSVKSDGFHLRYMPQGVDANNVMVSFDNLDDSKVIQRMAAQPFPEDPSIYSVIVGSSDCIAYDGMTVTLTEVTGANSSEIKFLADGDLVVIPSGQEARFI